jgi:hypothetical protein
MDRFISTAQRTSSLCPVSYLLLVFPVYTLRPAHSGAVGHPAF